MTFNVLASLVLFVILLDISHGKIKFSFKLGKPKHSYNSNQHAISGLESIRAMGNRKFPISADETYRNNVRDLIKEMAAKPKSTPHTSADMAFDAREFLARLRKIPKVADDGALNKKPALGWNTHNYETNTGSSRAVASVGAPLTSEQINNGRPPIGWKIPHGHELEYNKQVMNSGQQSLYKPSAPAIHANIDADGKLVASQPNSRTTPIGWNIPPRGHTGGTELKAEPHDSKYGNTQQHAPPIGWNIRDDANTNSKPNIHQHTSIPTYQQNPSIYYSTSAPPANRDFSPIQSHIPIHRTSSMQENGRMPNQHYQTEGYQPRSYHLGSQKPVASPHNQQHQYSGYHPGEYGGYGRSHGSSNVHYGPVTSVNGYQAPAYSYYHDTSDHSLLSFYVGYKIGQMFSHSHSTFYPRNTYSIHHYHQGDKEQTVPDNVTVVANAIVECTDKNPLLCIENTQPICTSNGTIMCVTRPELTTSCPENASLSCVTSAIKCNGRDSSLHKVCGRSTVQHTNILSVPCVSTVNIIGDLPTTLANLSKSSNFEVSQNISTETNNGTFVDGNNTIGHNLCVTVIAVPTPVKLVFESPLQDPELQEKTWELMTNILDSLWTG